MKYAMHTQNGITRIALLALLLAAFALLLGAPQTARADEEGAKSKRSSLEPSETDRAAWEELKALRLSRKLKVVEDCLRNGVAESPPPMDVSEMETPPTPGPLSFDTVGYEDFESVAIPSGGHWFTGDLNASDGLVYWDDCSNTQGFPVTAHEGDWVAWCADEGHADWSYYENNMSSYMYIECEYLGTTAWNDNSFWFQRWVDAQVGYDYFEYRLDGFIDMPGHGYGVGTPDASFTHQTDDTSGSWELGGLSNLGSGFDACRYLRITFYFYSNASIRLAYQGAAIDYVELNNRTTTAIYPIREGFQSPGAGFSTGIGGTFVSNDEWCYVAYWDGSIVKYDGWQYDGIYSWGMGLPFDRAVSAWLYSDTEATYVEAIQGYKWNLRP